MAKIIGDGKDNSLGAGSAGDEVFGQAGNDTLVGANDGVSLSGGGADDWIVGGTGDDVIHGGGGMPVGFSQFRVAETTTAKMTVSSDDADAHSDVVGMYSYDKLGNITGVKIVGAADAGAFDVGIAKDERLGFFFVPGGVAAGDAGWDAMLKQGSFKLETADGKPGNVADGKPLTLVSVDAEGKETAVPFQPGSQMFNSLKALNADGKSHIATSLDPVTGQVKVVFTADSPAATAGTSTTSAQTSGQVSHAKSSSESDASKGITTVKTVDKDSGCTTIVKTDSNTKVVTTTVDDSKHNTFTTKVEDKKSNVVTTTTEDKKSGVVCTKTEDSKSGTVKTVTEDKEEGIVSTKMEDKKSGITVTTSEDKKHGIVTERREDENSGRCETKTEDKKSGFVTTKHEDNKSGVTVTTTEDKKSGIVCTKTEDSKHGTVDVRTVDSKNGIEFEPSRGPQERDRRHRHGEPQYRPRFAPPR